MERQWYARDNETSNHVRHTNHYVIDCLGANEAHDLITVISSQEVINPKQNFIEIFEIFS